MSLNTKPVALVVVLVFIYFVFAIYFVDNSDREEIYTLGRKKFVASILYCIAAVSFDRVDTLDILLDNAVDWCEGGYRVSVIVDTYDVLTDILALQYELNVRHMCSRDVNAFSVSIELHDPHRVPQILVSNSYGEILSSMPKNLASFHRLHFNKYLSEFDIFMYSEDDMAIRLTHLNSWYKETVRLLQSNEAKDFLIPLIRYENTRVLERKTSSRRNIKKLTPNFQFIYQSTASNKTIPMARISWEANISKLVLINESTKDQISMENRNLANNYYITSSGDIADNSYLRPYAAVGLYLPAQLLELERKCKFLSQQVSEIFVFNKTKSVVTEFLGSLQPFECGNNPEYLSNDHMIDIELYCCKHWILPLDSLESFFIHHIGTPGQIADTKWANRHRIVNAHYIHHWKQRFQ